MEKQVAAPRDDHFTAWAPTLRFVDVAVGWETVVALTPDGTLDEFDSQTQQRRLLGRPPFNAGEGAFYAVDGGIEVDGFFPNFVLLPLSDAELARIVRLGVASRGLCFELSSATGDDEIDCALYSGKGKTTFDRRALRFQK